LSDADDDRVLRWSVILALGVVVVVSAFALRFSCDDAFITFRYVANAHAGHGLVWNPAPFSRSRVAMALPMPVAPPVTRARLPWMSMGCS
jgi:hypothetical protein